MAFLMCSAIAGKKGMSTSVFVVVLIQSKAGMSKLGDLLQDDQVGFWDAGITP